MHPANDDLERPVVRVQNLVEQLALLGLSKDEAGVYVHISMHGPSKAGDLARGLHISRGETYRILERLVSSGFATTRLGRPALYDVVDPDAMFDSLVAAEQARIAVIERVRSETTRSLRVLKATPPPARNSFKMIQGRQETTASLLRLIDGAEREIKFINTRDGPNAFARDSAFLDAIVERATNGVAVRGLVRVTPAAKPHYDRLADVPNVILQPMDTESLIRYYVVDDRELLMWVVNDAPARSSHSDVAMWTDAGDFVGTQRALFDGMWTTTAREDLPTA